MIITVLDTETHDIENPLPVELGWVTLGQNPKSKKWKVEDMGSSLLSIGENKISIKARAIHHISDQMLHRAPTLGGYFNDLRKDTPDIFDVCAAHNAAFDNDMVLKWPDKKWVCTYRCAMHLWPDAPGHSNQVLRYFMGVPDPISTLPPHRALPDAEITAGILLKMLEIKTVEELIALTTMPVLLKKIRVGKYRGQLYEDMVRRDPGYFRWMLNQDFDEDVKYTINFYMRG